MSAEPTQAAVASPAVRVYALGGFRVVSHGRPVDDNAWRRRTARQLFKALLTKPGRRMTRDEVVELLWPNSAVEAAASNLRSTVHALRRAIEPRPINAESAIVYSDRDGVWLANEEHLWLDADAFERAVIDARHAANPLALLQLASELYLGDYLLNDVYEDWATPRRDVLKRTWAGVQLRIAQILEGQGDIEEAILAVRRALECDRTDERAARELMRILIDQGRHSEATRVYQELSRALEDELGVSPSEQTLDLYRAALGPTGRASASQTSGFQCAYPFPAPAVLIGRDAEFQRVRRIIERGKASGQTILVSGPAGGGKSSFVGRLVEFAQRSGVLCLAGGSYDARTALPLEPFQEALADYVLNVSLEPADGGLVSATTQLADVVRELRQHLGISGPAASDSGNSRTRLFGAILAFLRRASERTPVLLCLEDLHAADAATLQLFHYLSRQTRTSRVVIVGSFRTEELHPGGPLGQLVGALVRERLADHVVLRPLDEEETGSLIGSLVAGPATQLLKTFVYSATEGNPLFTEQLVLSLREEGRLNRLEDMQRVSSGQIGVLPKAMRDVIDERLGRLSTGGRQTLETAAVLGPAFDHGTLLDILRPADEAALLNDLDEAIRARVLREIPTGYAFGHALLQEGLYWGMTGPRRMLLHARAGEMLERASDEDVPERAARLAHHFTLASPSPSNRSKAFRYSLQAGRAAAAVGSYREAMTHFAAACELMDQSGVSADPAEQLEALEGRGRAQRELALWQESIGTYRKVLAHTSTPQSRARARGMIAYGLQHTGEMTAALEELRLGLQDLDVVPESERIDEMLYLNQLVAWCWYLQGRHRDMLRLGHQMLEQASADGRPRSLMLALGVIATGYMGLGEVATGLAEQERRLGAAQQTGDRIAVAIALENLGLQNYLGGRFETARAHLEEALAIYRETASDLRAVNARQHLCRVWVAEGELERALEQTQLAVELEEAGQERWAADGHQILGTIHGLRAEWSAARSNFEAGLRIRDRSGDTPGLVESMVALGSVAEYVGDWQQSAQRYHEALDLAQRIDAGPTLAQAQRSLAGLLMRRGDHTGARTLLESALQLVKTISDTLEFGPTLLGLADWHASDQDFESALRLAEQSLNTPGTLEHALAANVSLATIHRRLGNHQLAMRQAEAGLVAARQLASPQWMSRAYLAVAEASVETNLSGQEPEGFRLAIEWATKARVPYLRATSLSAYAAYRAERVGSESPAVSAMQNEASDILRNLRRAPG